MEGVIPFTIGHHDSKRDISLSPDDIQQAHDANYDLITVPITNPSFQSRVLTLISSYAADTQGSRGEFGTANAPAILVQPLSPSDTQLTPNDATGSVIGVTSTWIDLSSPDPVIAEVSRQVFSLELAYAAFCGLTYILISAPRCTRDANVAAYARAILDGLNEGPYMQLFVWSDMVGSTAVTDQVGDLASYAKSSSNPSSKTGLFDTWEQWDTIRSICLYSTRLCVALSMPSKLPLPAVQTRWYSEPIRMLTFSAASFSKNPSGYPSLSIPHQDFIFRVAKLKTTPWLVLCDVGKLQLSDTTDFPTIAEAKKPNINENAHIMYMRNLQTRQRVLTEMDRFGQGYQDYLQAPLQPLTVNLESMTYEVFEKDPIKYLWYERAVARALHDWIEEGKPTSNPDGRVVVAVVGAGRGPLVTRALRAADDVGVDIDMWALEKNPNAFVLLQRHNQADGQWRGRVNLAHGDMRTWSGPTTTADLSEVIKVYNLEGVDTDSAAHSDLPNGTGSLPSTRYKIDILISELLGSFADNELSPECLDGVQHLLNPDHGISIPTSYTAHFTPIAAPKLHADISLSMSQTTPHAAETPYVVMLDQIDYLSTKPPRGNDFPKPIVHTAWSFAHPSPYTTSTSNSHNSRYTSFAFPIINRGTSHGLAGYFETILYHNPNNPITSRTELSTNPLTLDKSPGMISWFPIFFPFKQPLVVPEGGQMRADMWRKTDGRRVWYEWVAEVSVVVGDRVVTVGRTELCSSVKEACLM